jgi:signal transduction histidine kinase
MTFFCCIDLDVTDRINPNVLEVDKNTLNIFHGDFFSKNPCASVIDPESHVKKHTRFFIKSDEFYLTIDEALTNAMEHGNLWAPDRKITVDMNLSKTELAVSISDEGGGFRIKKNKPIGLNRDDKFRHRGRGLFIISQFCEPSWNRNGTKITMRFRIKE